SDVCSSDLSFLPVERYFATRKRIYVHTSRGCAFRCTYCSVPTCWGTKVRIIPMERVLVQLKQHIVQYAPEEVQIVDDNFSHKGGRYIEEFCKGLNKSEITIRWKCQVRADQLSPELVDLMAKSDCFEIDLGIESGNREMQKRIR